jgi:hypothetical protein
MVARYFLFVLSLATLAFAQWDHPHGPSSRAPSPPSSTPVAQVSIGSDTYSYYSLVGHGFWAAASQDEFGDTSGGWGSAIAADVNSWHQNGDGSYEGTIYTLPDRGWNTNGTFFPGVTDVQERLISRPEYTNTVFISLLITTQPQSVAYNWSGNTSIVFSSATTAVILPLGFSFHHSR